MVDGETSQGATKVAVFKLDGAALGLDVMQISTFDFVLHDEFKRVEFAFSVERYF